MNKKFTSAVLAGAMAISALSVSAFAAEDTQKLQAAGEKTLKATAAFAPVTIDVTLPTSITAAINPYKIDYDFAGTKAGTSGVISPVYEIKNDTADYGVKVAAKVWATPASTVTVATVGRTKEAPVFKNDNTEDKTVFAYLNTTVAEDKSFANTTYKADDPTQVLFTEDEPDNAVKLMDIGKGGKSGYFQIQGDCVEEPAEKWDTKDTVELSIVFDINPFNEGGEGGTNYTNPAGTTGAVSASAGTLTRTGDNTYTLAGMTTSSAAIDLDLKLETGYTVTRTVTTVSGDACVTANTAGKITPTGDTGKCTITYTINDGEGDPTGGTIVVTVEITA